MELPYKTMTLTASCYYIQLFVDFFNKRLRVDDYRGNVGVIVEELDKLMERYQFTKLIFYTKSPDWPQLLVRGYELEGMIEGYFNGANNYIMTSYKDVKRRTSSCWIQENDILGSILGKVEENEVLQLPQGYSSRRATLEDANRLAALYRKVFAVYPTPMNNPKYVTKMLEGGTIFYIVEYGDRESRQLVSAASAEINRTHHNAELTDCATLPEHRKYGLMKILLHRLETELLGEGIYCAYSLARALSYGMNAALYQLGYQYNGRLTNNCYIFEQLEDMNIWVKNLAT